MRVEVVRNFLSADDCAYLNEWAHSAVGKGWIDSGYSNGQIVSFRLTSRIYGNRFQNPQRVQDIARRVREFCGVDTYSLINGHGRDGVVVSYTKPGGDVYKHRDPTASDGTPTLRCNIMTQAADSGGKLFIDGQHFDVGVGDLHCYLVSEHEHWVEPIEGNTPRIMWMFGAHVPAKDWNDFKIQLKDL